LTAFTRFTAQEFTDSTGLNQREYNISVVLPAQIRLPHSV